MSHNRTSVTVIVPRAQLEPAVLNVKRSYVFAQQQGLLNRIGNFFSGNPNSQHQVYVVAQRKIQNAARHSPLLTQAQRNTRAMLTGLLRSLGFQHVTVTFVPPAKSSQPGQRGSDPSAATSRARIARTLTLDPNRVRKGRITGAKVADSDPKSS